MSWSQLKELCALLVPPRQDIGPSRVQASKTGRTRGVRSQEACSGAGGAQARSGRTAPKLKPKSIRRHNTIGCRLRCKAFPGAKLDLETEQTQGAGERRGLGSLEGFLSYGPRHIVNYVGGMQALWDMPNAMAAKG